MSRQLYLINSFMVYLHAHQHLIWRNVVDWDTVNL